MVAKNYYTQAVAEFFSTIRDDREKSSVFRRAIFDVVREHGRTPSAREVGAVLAAGLICSATPSMEEAPALIQQIVARVLASEVDWEHVAQLFLVDETSN